MFSVNRSAKSSFAPAKELYGVLQGLQPNQQSGTAPKKVGYLSADGTEMIKAEQPNLQQQQRDQAKAQKNALLRVRLQTNWRGAAVQTYLRLARASTVREAKSVAYSAANQVYQLKRALSGECEEATQVKAVLSQVQKAVIRAKLKARQLGDEQGLLQREKKAQEQERKARAMYLEQERQKRIVLRKTREEGYVRESVVARYLAAERLRQQVEYTGRAPGETGEITGGTITAAPVQVAATPVAAVPPPVVV